MSLKQLIQQWDQKLKQSGFVDIEDRKTGLLNTWSGKIFYGSSIIKDDNFVDKINKINRTYGYNSLTYKESEAEYFRLASHCLHEREFKSVRHRLIWQLHSEGLSYQKIAQELNITERKVRYAIEVMAKEFCLK